MPSRIDVNGRRFGKLTVLGMAGPLWKCRCDCGAILERSARDLMRWKEPSCGCVRHLSPGITWCDITGQRFGRLTAISRLPKYRSDNLSYWKCRCDCGNERNVSLGNLRGGSTTSCGCFKNELFTKLLTKHGCTAHGKVTSEYRAWAAAKSRCHNENNRMYCWYGARGIRMCERWFNSFESFLSDMGTKPKGMTLDRIDNDGNYEPSNCRWADYRTQNNNKKHNRRIRAFGEIMTAAQWARKFRLTSSIISNRIRWGWNAEEAITTPRKLSMKKD